VLQNADTLVAKAEVLASGKVSILRIGGTTNTIERVLPPLIKMFREKSATVKISLTAGSGSGLLASLERGELDIVITRQAISSMLDSTRVFPFHVLAILPASHLLTPMSD
jgi:DNA-binding transcriptional LysR family regulator